MAKVNYVKVEKAFDKAVQKLTIDNLADLASIATAINAPDQALSNKQIAEVIIKFHKELKKLKKHDPKLFQKLELSIEDEARLALTADQFQQSDWLRLKTLKEKIESLKKELYGEEIINEENEVLITKERKRHINKRFNIRDGWLPLD